MVAQRQRSCAGRTGSAVIPCEKISTSLSLHPFPPLECQARTSITCAGLYRCTLTLSEPTNVCASTVHACVHEIQVYVVQLDGCEPVALFEEAGQVSDIWGLMLRFTETIENWQHQLCLLVITSRHVVLSLLYMSVFVHLA